MHFGLGDASRVENLEVQWPSGQIDRLKDLEADAGYRIREGEPAPLPLPGFPRPALK